MPTRLFDHIDLRVRSVAAAKPFYDPFLRSLGLRGKVQPDSSIVYLRITGGTIHEAIALLEDPAHRPNATRVAFAAEGSGIVDQITATLRACRAKAIEGPEYCPEIAPDYYAVFFEDTEGNRFEVVCR